MNTIDKLSEIFSHFPGIGPRQSKRFVYFLLTRNGNYIENLNKLLTDLKKEIKQCERCYRFFPKTAGSNSFCPICRDEHRDTDTLMVVARDVDFENIEKSRSFNGRYFILGGSLAILEKEPEKRIRIRNLESRIKEDKGTIKEIILAMNANPEGENTADYLRQIIAPVAEKNGIKISVLGRGLSTGTELEYSDDETIKNALKNRA